MFYVHINILFLNFVNIITFWFNLYIYIYINSFVPTSMRVMTFITLMILIGDEEYFLN